MELKLLKVGTAYATCDGDLVVPQAPLSSKYVIQVKDAKGEKLKEPVIFEDNDPWGPCVVDERRDTLARTRVRTWRSGRSGGAILRGVKVLVFEYDKQGKPKGKGKPTVVPTRDIVGLWDDYVIRHGRAIKQRVETQERNRAERELRDEIDNALRGTGWSARLHFRDGRLRDWELTRYDRKNGVTKADLERAVATIKESVPA